MSEQDNAAHVTTMLTRTRVAGDLDGVMACFADDITFQIAGLGAPVSGRAAVRAYLEPLFADIAFLSVDPIETLAQGDRVALRYRLKLRHVPSGRVVDTEVADFATLRDGRCISYVQYADTAMLRDLQGLRIDPSTSVTSRRREPGATIGEATMLERSAVEQVWGKVRHARVAGDVEAIVAVFGDDATFRIVGHGEPARGKAAIRAALDGLVRRYKFLTYDPIRIFVDGDEAAIRHRLVLQDRATGGTIETETADFLTIKDGRCAAYVQYIDTALAQRLAGG